jgi:hypothetical protein
MNRTVNPTTGNAENVVAFVEKLAADAPYWDPAQLAVVWKEVERRLLPRLRQDERRSGSLQASHAPPAERSNVDFERMRNLAWEIAVSIEVGCVHVRALSRLAELLKELDELDAGSPHLVSTRS